jgi:adenylate cyclase
LQVDVVSRLANSLGAQLVKAEALRSMRERPHNPDAADLAMPASARFNSSGDSKLIQSDIIDLSERALALDPQNEPAMVDFSEALTDRVTNQWSANPEGNLAHADKLAAPLGPSAGRCVAYMAKAEVFFNKHQWRAAISQGEAARLRTAPTMRSAASGTCFSATARRHRRT